MEGEREGGTHGGREGGTERGKKGERGREGRREGGKGKSFEWVYQLYLISKMA